MTTATPATGLNEVGSELEIREGEYGDAINKVEPGGAEFIPPAERHGKPTKLFWTWMSPNFEFATVFVGVLAVTAFGLTLPVAIAGIVLGTVLGSVTHAALSADGPLYGVPQMVLSRVSFGYWGNVLPAGINSLIAGIGWFAVNSVSGALALNSLLHWNKVLCLLIIVAVQIGVAFFGHNVVHLFEKVVFPLLVIAFVLAAGYTFAKGHYSHEAGGGGTGGFFLTVAATFGYAVGWNPYASDYTRYLPPTVSRRATGLWAGLGVALSCVFLEVLGAVSGTITGFDGLAGPGPFVGKGIMPTGIGDLTLVAIAVGAVAANALNVYSGSISFTTLGIRIPLEYRRAVIATLFGVIGFFVAWSGLSNAASKYNDFLLVIAYWIGPWLAVVFTDKLLRRRQDISALFYEPKHVNWGGPVAMLAGMAVSIPLFSNQSDFLAVIPKHHPGVGDLTFEVGFVVAALVYYLLYPLQQRERVISLPQ